MSQMSRCGVEEEVKVCIEVNVKSYMLRLVSRLASKSNVKVSIESDVKVSV